MRSDIDPGDLIQVEPDLKKHVKGCYEELNEEITIKIRKLEDMVKVKKLEEGE